MRDHERRLLDLLDDPGHRRRLPGARRAEHRLVALAGEDPLAELRDRVRLVAGGLVGVGGLERRHAAKRTAVPTPTTGGASGAGSSCRSVIDANTSESSVTTAATPKKTGSTPQRSSTWPASRKPSGAATVCSEMIAAITFGRSASGVRAVSTPITRAVDERREERRDEERERDQPGLLGHGQHPERDGEREDPERRQPQRGHAPDEEDGEDRPDERARAERCVEEPGHPRAEGVVREHRQRRPRAPRR